MISNVYKTFMTLMFSVVCWASISKADDQYLQCQMTAQAQANRVFEQTFNNCLSGNPQGPNGPVCQSDWECSPGESCIQGRCVIQPVCSARVTCDECTLGQRSCRIIDCRGQITGEYKEACYSRNRYVCGGCRFNAAHGSFGYDVYIMNQKVSGEHGFASQMACADARATDPRCNGN
jgi:hypothetical protein